MAISSTVCIWLLLDPAMLCFFTRHSKLLSSEMYPTNVIRHLLVLSRVQVSWRIQWASMSHPAPYRADQEQMSPIPIDISLSIEGLQTIWDTDISWHWKPSRGNDDPSRASRSCLFSYEVIIQSRPVWGIANMYSGGQHSYSAGQTSILGPIPLTSPRTNPHLQR